MTTKDLIVKDRRKIAIRDRQTGKRIFLIWDEKEQKAKEVTREEYEKN